ncbi:uncharacterized protein TNCV_1075551 [Trichonephila clavipes]|uniref:Uncharacterized protein n=1 Tax=Trichonephila clavipes TaxID=2585209 RepID=A0A8X6SUV2_TRICX|nr:uncharacterized protein TNCV_1075551 [Trichonephila clavipes]
MATTSPDDKSYLSPTEKTSRHRIRAYYEQLFEKSRIIGLKETGRANWRISRHMGRCNAITGRCWQEWLDSDKFQLSDGSGQPRATADRKDRLIVK